MNRAQASGAPTRNAESAWLEQGAGQRRPYMKQEISPKFRVLFPKIGVFFIDIVSLFPLQFVCYATRRAKQMGVFF